MIIKDGKVTARRFKWCPHDTNGAPCKECIFKFLEYKRLEKDKESLPIAEKDTTNEVA